MPDLNPVFTFTERSYIDRQWTVHWGGGNWMAVLWRDGDGPWLTRCRARLYVDDKVDGSRDQKIISPLVTLDTEDRSRDAARRTVTMMAERIVDETGGTLDVLVVEGDMDRFMALLQDDPAMHLQTLRPHERPQ